MRFSTGKRVVLILLMAAAILTLLPANEHAAENSAKDQAALSRSTASRVPQTANPFGLNSLVDTRWDIYEIISHKALPAGQFADTLIEQLFNWSGKPSGQALDDDLTLIVADYQHV
jgi:hypothetical protein